MIVECRNGHKNRIPDAPAEGRRYFCPKCKCEIHVLWPEARAAANSEDAGTWNAGVQPPAVSKIPGLICIILLAAAVLGKWPYGFYVFLRFAVCGSAAYLTFEAVRLRKNIWAWLLGGMAVLFNPVIRVPMPRADWQVVDLFAGLIMVASLFGVRSPAAKQKQSRAGGAS